MFNCELMNEGSELTRTLELFVVSDRVSKGDI
jgi:hypothetical protein